jgi:hypothetical protein
MKRHEHARDQTLGAVEGCVVGVDVDVVAATVFGDHASTGRMNLIADSH